MPLPDPDYFTVDDLVERWAIKYGECTASLVLRYIKANPPKLIAEPIRGPGRWKTEPNWVMNWKGEGQTTTNYPGPVIGYKITLAEVLRFEAENPPTSATPEPATTTKTKSTTTTENGSGKVQRNDALNKIVIQIRADYIAKNVRTPQYNDVVNKLKSLCPKGAHHPVLQEITGKVIYWINRNGKQKETPIRELQKRLTRLNAV